MNKIVKFSLLYFSHDKKSWLLNTLGLSAGLSIILLILSYQIHQSDYDKFWPNHENIFRIRRAVTYHGDKTNIALTNSKLVEALSSLPEVEVATGFMKNQSELLFRRNDDLFIENNGLICDKKFLEVFDVKLKLGSDRKGLDNPNSIMISESFSKKHLGNINPIGNYLSITDEGIQKQLIITGLFNDIPTNSSLRFDFLISGSTFSYWQQMIDNGILPTHTFILVKSMGVTETFLNQKLAILNKEISPPSDIITEDTAQKLDDIHINSGLLFDFSKSINLIHYKVLGLVSILLSLITVFNFMSTMSNKTLNRKGSYAILKVYGATNLSLLVQQLIETVIYFEGAFILSIIVAELLLVPIMGNLTSLHLSILNNLGTLLVFNAIFLLVAEVATLIYSIPIIRISTLIKDVKRTSQIRGNIFSAKTFILILQFGISFGFITWFLVSHKQLNYLSNIDLGYKKSNIICLRYNSNISQANWINLKNELSINSQFASVSGSQYKLIGELNASVIEKENNEAIKVMWNRVDYNFLPSLKMKLISGRNFSRDIPADKNGIIINETAWRALSDSTIQKVRFPIVNRENATTIIGVVKDFHFESFNNKIPPLVLGLKDDFSKYIYIETNDNIKSSIKNLREVWRELKVESPFEFELLDDSFNSIIQEEVIIEKVSIIFMFCSVVLSLVGLSLSTSYYIRSNNKVFSIKKILGASERELIFGMYIMFAIKIFIGLIIAMPICYFTTNAWLFNYPYRIDFPFSYFFFVSGSILIFASIIILIGGLRLYSLKAVDQLREN